MSVKTGFATLAAASLLAVGLGTHAIASGNDAEERAAMASANITLSDAIALAEKEVGGRAVEAEVEDEDGGVFYYEVEVIMPDGAEKEVLIDMGTGEIVKIEDEDRG